MAFKRCTVIFVAILATVMAVGFADETDNETTDNVHYGIKIYPSERQCAMVGGMCVQKSDCKEKTSTSGLCPKSKHLGVECCYELKWRPLPCEQYLGMCMPRCGKALQRPATDCENGEVCCILV